MAASWADLRSRWKDTGNAVHSRFCGARSGPLKGSSAVVYHRSLLSGLQMRAVLPR